MPQDRRFDPTKVVFPSDKITFGEMRRLEPERFTPEAIHRDAVSECEVLGTYIWELALAEKAFAKAIGAPDPHPGESQRFIIDELLHEGYQLHGQSRGINETRRLAAEIETAARQQAGNDAKRTR